MDNTSPIARPGDTNWFTDGVAGPKMNVRGEVLFDGGKAWTTTPPTEPGWYWAFPFISGPLLVLVSEFIGQVGLRAKSVLFVEYYSCELSEFSHWLGPLPVPEPPVDTPT